jgi:hypothetical protein
MNVTETLPVCLCGSDNTIHCTQDVTGQPLLQTGYYCGNDRIRKQTPTDNNFINLDDINALMDHTQDRFVPSPNLTWPTPSGITE